MKNIESRMLFGFALLLILGGLALAIGLGEVKQETSHGLDMVLGGLLTLTGQFSNWAFGKALDVIKTS